MASLPQYLMGIQGQLDFEPINQGLGRYFQRQQMEQENQRQAERMAMEQQRLGFESERLGFERARQPYELAGLDARTQAAKAELGLIPGRYDMQREEIAGARQRREQSAEMHPLELAAKTRALQTDPLMIVPSGATVLNRQTGEATQPGGKNWDKLPEFAAKSAAFASRMVDAERNVQAVLDNAAKRAAEKTGGFDPAAPRTAIYNAMPETIANLTVRDPDFQSYRQAAEQWIRAFLRKESGAAISKDEFERDFIVYFPQPGNGPEVIQQKQEARFQAMKGFAEETRGYFAETNPVGAKILQKWTPNPARRPAVQALQAGAQNAASVQQPQSSSAAPQAVGTQPERAVRVRTPEDARKLPSGTTIIMPDGSLGRVP